MPHPRQLVREAVAAVLTGATSAGDRVYRSRAAPQRRAELPSITIFTPEESVDAESINYSPRELQRDISVVLRCWVAVSDDRADDAMDALAVEIEAAMHADFYLGGAAADLLLSTTNLDVIDDGDRQLGMMAMIYAVRRRDIVPAPPDNLDDFNTAGVTHNLNNTVHPDEVAKDLVTVQEGT